MCSPLDSCGWLDLQRFAGHFAGPSFIKAVMGQVLLLAKSCFWWSHTKTVAIDQLRFYSGVFPTLCHGSQAVMILLMIILKILRLFKRVMLSWISRPLHVEIAYFIYSLVPIYRFQFNPFGYRVISSFTFNWTSKTVSVTILWLTRVCIMGSATVKILAALQVLQLLEHIERAAVSVGSRWLFALS